MGARCRRTDAHRRACLTTLVVRSGACLLVIGAPRPLGGCNPRLSRAAARDRAGHRIARAAPPARELATASIVWPQQASQPPRPGRSDCARRRVHQTCGSCGFVRFPAVSSSDGHDWLARCTETGWWKDKPLRRIERRSSGCYVAGLLSPPHLQAFPRPTAHRSSSTDRRTQGDGACHHGRRVPCRSSSSRTPR